MLNHIGQDTSLEYVVLSSQFKQYLRDLRGARQLRMRTRDGEFSGGPESALRAFVGTIQQIRRYGKKVVIVAPAPSTGVNYALCIERKQTGLPMAGSLARTGCDMPEAQYAAKSAAVIAFLRKVSSVAGVSVIWPSDSLCDGRRCRTSEGEVPFYRDEEHLSRDGSILFARESGLFDKAIASAR